MGKMRAPSFDILLTGGLLAWLITWRKLGLTPAVVRLADCQPPDARQAALLFLVYFTIGVVCRLVLAPDKKVIPTLRTFELLSFILIWLVSFLNLQVPHYDPVVVERFAGMDDLSFHLLVSSFFLVLIGILISGTIIGLIVGFFDGFQSIPIEQFKGSAHDILLEIKMLCFHNVAMVGLLRLGNLLIYVPAVIGSLLSAVEPLILHPLEEENTPRWYSTLKLASFRVLEFIGFATAGVLALWVLGIRFLPASDFCR